MALAALALGMISVPAHSQIDDVVVGIEQVEVAEISGDTLIVIIVNNDIGSEIDYPCAETDVDRLLVALAPGLNPGGSWKMLHATLLAALSRGASVRIRMGDCVEYKPGHMAREIVGVTMLR